MSRAEKMFNRVQKLADAKLARLKAPYTNADRIRAMSDEELAAFLEGLVMVALGDYSLRDNQRRLDWLRQEATQ